MCSSGMAQQPDTILKLLKSSGIISQLEQAPASIWMSLPSDTFYNETQRNEAFRQFKKSLSPEFLNKLATEHFASEFNEENVQEMIRFFDSTLGRKLSRVQRNLLDVHNIRNLRESRRAAAMLEDDRLEVINKLIDVQQALKTNSSLTSTLLKSLISNESDQEKISSLTLDKNLMEETILLAYANNLKNFDNDELTSLVDFFGRAEAKWFMSINHSLNIKIMAEAGRVLSETFDKLREISKKQ